RFAFESSLFPEHIAGGAVEAVDLPAIGGIRRFAASETARPESAETTTATGTTTTKSLSHISELFVLILGEDLFELGVSFFLQILHLFVLIGGELQLILSCGRHDLSGLREAAKAAGTEHWRL